MPESRDLLFRFLGDARDLANASRQAKTSLGTVDDAQKKTAGGFKGLAGSTKALVAGGVALVASGVVRFLGDAAKSAIEDAAAQEQLRVAMRNTVGATDEQVAATEEWIDATARATGVTDNELRPALSELLRATGDTEQAQRRLGESMDIATAKGLPLETVVRAVGKAAQGNVGALGRLGVNVRDSAGDFVDFDQAMENAAETMGGAMEAAANTSEGRLKRWAIVVDEAKESLGGLVLEGLGRAAQGAERLGNVLDQSVTGNIEDFEIITRKSADTAAAAITIMKDYGREFEELAPHLNLSTDELKKLRDADRDFLQQLGFTIPEIEELNRQVGRELANAAHTARSQALHPTRDDLEEVAGAFTDAAEGTQEYADAQRALIDPAFAVFDAVEDVRQATEDYNAALADTGPNSMETRDAAQELAEAMLGLDSANARYAEEGGPQSLEALRNMLSEAGVAEEAIDNLIRAIEEYNRKPVVKKHIVVDSKGRPILDPVKGTFDAGGVVPGPRGSPQLVQAHGGETILPTHKPNAVSVASTGTTINLTIQGFVGTPAQVAAEIDRLLTERARRNGLGFTQGLRSSP